MSNSLDVVCVITKRVIVIKFKFDQVCIADHKTVFNFFLSLKNPI